MKCICFPCQLKQGVLEYSSYTIQAPSSSFYLTLHFTREKNIHLRSFIEIGSSAMRKSQIFNKHTLRCSCTNQLSPDVLLNQCHSINSISSYDLTKIIPIGRTLSLSRLPFPCCTLRSRRGPRMKLFRTMR